jgi:16S rRNA (guanine(966)-N(2))-methyltransferase RsmD
MGKLRIDAGSLKGNFIHFPDIRGLRPLTSSIKKAIFDIIDVEGKTILDLFAGTGIFGMEAISRGAKSAVFVEKSEILARSIEKNLSRLGIKNAYVLGEDACRFLSKQKEAEFDVIFADPPFDLKISTSFVKDMIEKTKYVSILRRRKEKGVNLKKVKLEDIEKEFEKHGENNRVSEFSEFVKLSLGIASIDIRIYSDSILFIFFRL